MPFLKKKKKEEEKLQKCPFTKKKERKKYRKQVKKIQKIEGYILLRRKFGRDEK